MARIEGIDLPGQKRVEIGLTYIYGIGRKTAQNIVQATKVDPQKRIHQLEEAEIAAIRSEIEKYTLEGELRSQYALDIKRLMDIASYRGLRHRKGLPVRGQRSKTNARTRKGRGKTLANKKK